MLTRFIIFGNINIRKRYFVYWYPFDPLEQFNTRSLHNRTHQTKKSVPPYILIKHFPSFKSSIKIVLPEILAKILIKFLYIFVNLLIFSKYWTILFFMTAFLCGIIYLYFYIMILIIRIFNSKIEILRWYKRSILKLIVVRFFPAIDAKFKSLFIRAEVFLTNYVWDYPFIITRLLFFWTLLWMQSSMADVVYWELRSLSIVDPTIAYYLLDYFICALSVFAMILTYLIRKLRLIERGWVRSKKLKRLRHQLKWILRLLTPFYSIFMLSYIFWYIHCVSVIITWIYMNW